MNKTLFALTIIASTSVLAHDESARLERLLNLSQDPKTPPINIMTIEQLGFTGEAADKLLKEKSVVASKGYHEQSTNAPKNMFHLKTNVHAFSDSNEKNPHGTAIKKHLSNIPLTFKFSGIPFIPQNDVLGWAASSTFNKAWSGVAEYFKYPKIGICTYEIMDIKTSNATIYLRADLVTKDVNGKYTRYLVKGNKNDGFLYITRWYDNNYWHTLECSQQTFSRDTEKSMLDLASKIDRSII